MTNKPIYIKIYDKLKSAIKGGTYPPGSFLPTEQELETLYQVSRTTIRKAVKLLSDEGTGEMFTKVPETLLDKLASQYNLSDKGRIILKTYLNAPEDQQDALENFLLTLAENMKKESD